MLTQSHSTTGFNQGIIVLCLHMTDRVAFTDTLNGLPQVFLTKEFVYYKQQPADRVMEDSRQVDYKEGLLRKSRSWPACTDYRRLTRRIEQVHEIRPGKTYRTVRRYYRRKPRPMEFCHGNV